MKAVINSRIIFSNKIICYTLIFLIIFFGLQLNSSYVSATSNTTPFPDLGAEAAVVIDATTGKVLFEQNKDQSMFPASTTKLMTALLAAENLSMAGEIMIDKETAQVGEASMNLKEGEIITVENILKGLLIVSGNDAAVALAKAVSGDVGSFAILMNAKAAELGAKNTNFANPNGLHDDYHYTTAYDMALIAQAALNVPTIREIVGRSTDSIPATNLTTERKLKNTNQLIRDTPYKYEGATGMKTGYTPEAGNCLVASAKRNDTEFIAVVLNSSELGRFGDCTILLNYAFSNYKTIAVIEAGSNLGTVKVKRGAETTVNVIAKDTIAATLPINASQDIVSTKLEVDKKIEAPIKKGQKLGIVNIYQVGEIVGTVDAVAAANVEVGGPLSAIGISDKAAEILKIILISVVVLMIILLWIYVVLKRREVRRKKQRKLERQQKRRKTPQEEALEAFRSDPRNYERARRR